MNKIRKLHSLLYRYSTETMADDKGDVENRKQKNIINNNYNSRSHH